MDSIQGIQSWNGSNQLKGGGFGHIFKNFIFFLKKKKKKKKKNFNFFM